MFHTVSPWFSLFWEAFWLVLFGCVCFGLFFVLFCFGRLPTMSRWRSFLPDLMTVRAVMVRAALEKKKAYSPSTTFSPCPLSSSPLIRLPQTFISYQFGLYLAVFMQFTVTLCPCWHQRRRILLTEQRL